MPDSAPQIFAVPSEALADFYVRPEFCADRARVRGALDVIRRAGRFYSREWAEQTEAVRQIIPCAIVRNGARLLRLRRARRGRDDLRLRHTLLFGGQVDAADAEEEGGDFLRRCAVRELREELGLRAAVHANPIGVVADTASASGRRHFGVVFECEIAADVMSVPRECDGAEFVNSGRANTYSLTAVNEFAADGFDPWSSLLLASDFARRNLGRDFSVQPSLGLAGK